MKQMKKLPPRKDLNLMIKKLSSDKVIGSSLLPDNASQIDKLKFKSCEMIIRYRQATALKQKDLALKLKIDESRMSEILHYKIEKFTLERLIGYVTVLYPQLKIELKAA